MFGAMNVIRSELHRLAWERHGADADALVHLRTERGTSRFLRVR